MQSLDLTLDTILNTVILNKPRVKSRRVPKSLIVFLNITGQSLFEAAHFLIVWIRFS